LPPGPGAGRRTPSELRRHRRRGSAAYGLSSSRTPISFYLIRRPRFRAASGWRHSTRSRPTARQPAARGQVSRQRSQDSGRRMWSGNTTGSHDVAEQQDLGLLQTARLTAMVNTVGADALISCLFAKYHYLFWRPVTAIDPTAVTADGFGPIPGYDDANAATVEQLGWRPLLVTPNHPELPPAHG